MHKELRGLGIINLQKMNLALRAGWLWLSRVEASRPWKEFDIQRSLRLPPPQWWVMELPLSSGLTGGCRMDA
jgi:hypothetical protein